MYLELVLGYLLDVQTVVPKCNGKDNYTLGIRDRESEQDENKAEKCRQHFLRQAFESFVKTAW